MVALADQLLPFGDGEHLFVSQPSDIVPTAIALFEFDKLIRPIYALRYLREP